MSHAAMQSVYGDGCCAGVPPHPAPDSNLSDSGQVRLLTPSVNNTLHLSLYADTKMGPFKFLCHFIQNEVFFSALSSWIGE